MKPIQCDVCHKYYDAEKYGSCPHCIAAQALQCAAEADDGLRERERPARRSIFRKHKQEKTPAEEFSPRESASVETPSDVSQSDSPPPDDEATIPARRTDLEPLSQTPPAQLSPDGDPADADAPVAGWLVCTCGAYKGRSFELPVGRSVIGRGSTAQVCLAKEHSVADKHAAVTYEPKKKTFLLENEGDAPTFLNGEKLTQAAELKSFDEIAFADASFVFVRLCGSRFSWEKLAE
jgi:hypothetical protein